MATIAGKHRSPARRVTSNFGDALDELQQVGAVLLIALLLAVMDLFIVLALWQVAPVLAGAVGAGLAALVVVLVHRMRRPTNG